MKYIKCPFCEHKIEMSLLNIYNNDKKILKRRCINKICNKEIVIPLNKYNVYLSRTFNSTYMKYNYANYIKSNFSGILNIIDPLDYLTKDIINNPDKIVDFDKKLIDKCDILIAFINEPTFGTIGELHYAIYKNIDVYVINNNIKYINDPWLKYIVKKIYTNIDNCYNEIINELLINKNL